MSSLLLLSGLLVSAAALQDGFGQTPVMGFNTYNAASCTINQTFIQDSINAFANQGFRNAGYKYFTLDCGWQGQERQSNGSITYDAGAFPDGMLPLAELANNNGFQWGMYTDEGVKACAPSNPPPGSLGYETQDAQQFTGWRVVYMKVDNCYVTANEDAPKDPRTDFPSRYGKMSTALQNVGIEGMLVCEWGVPYQNPQGLLEGPAEWTPPLSTSFRVSDDISDDWNAVQRIMNEAINVNVRGLSGPGNFADMDLLEVGNPGLTVTEQASHFAIWAMFKSALMVSTPLSSLSTTARSVLQNSGLIAINQDSLGKPVKLTQRFSLDNDQFAGPLANGDLAVLLLDQSNTQRNLGIYFSALNISSADVTNLWTGQTVKGANNYFTTVQPRGTVPLRLTNIVAATPPNPQIQWYQASTAELAGGANVQDCTGCSNGKKAGYVGNGGTLTFTNVASSQTYQDVRMDYIDCEIGYLGDANGNVRGASISVNGNNAVSVIFPLTGYNWSQDVYKNFLVRLYGFNTNSPNTIEISGLESVSQYAPDFDRIGTVVG